MRRNGPCRSTLGAQQTGLVPATIQILETCGIPDPTLTQNLLSHRPAMALAHSRSSNTLSEFHPKKNIGFSPHPPFVLLYP